jgi:hypothetical protein
MEKRGRGDDPMLKTAAIPGRERQMFNPLKGSPDLAEVAFRIENSTPGGGLENLKNYAQVIREMHVLAKQNHFIPWVLLAQVKDHALRGMIVSEFLTPNFIKGESLMVILQKLNTVISQNTILDDNESRFRIYLMLDNQQPANVAALAQNIENIMRFCTPGFDRRVVGPYIDALPHDRGLQDAVRYAVGL